MMDVADSASMRAEHDALMAQLASRDSTPSFARAALAIFVALLLAGLSGKLFWDSQMKLALVAGPLGVGAIALLLWGGWQYVRGRRYLTTERQRFERLCSLRRALGLDEPLALTPR